MIDTLLAILLAICLFIVSLAVAAAVVAAFAALRTAASNEASSNDVLDALARLEDFFNARLKDFEGRLSPQVAGRYTLAHRLGEGAVGVVWLALDEQGKTYALKKLKAEHVDERSRGRFAREARVALKMDHANIVKTYEMGEDDDVRNTPFMVMQLTDGRTLRDVLEQRIPPYYDVTLCCDVGAQVAAALAYVRAEHNVVHRDIKPENILMPAGGGCLLTDFGLGFVASVDSEDWRVTELGIISGTPHYMSPEQSHGHQDIKGPSDIYSLGCVLYELLTGAPPFDAGPGETMALLLKHQAAPRPELQGPNAELNELVVSMLAVTPEDRPTPKAVHETLVAIRAKVRGTQ